MKTKHTKGNWQKEGELDNLEVTAEHPKTGIHDRICKVVNWETADRLPRYEEYEANAKLIAAAPEMLKELNELIKIATLIHKNRPDKYNVIDYATLAKAILKTEQLIKKATN